MLRIPGVYRPRRDTSVLCRVLAETGVPADARALDVCTGTGQVAIAAARSGAAQVTAVDISRRAVFTASVNGYVRRLGLRVRRGDLFAPVAGELFDLITANPPYVPRAQGDPRRHGRGRAWDAGPDGRATLDRICVEAPSLLAPGGVLLMVHSGLCGVARTLEALRSAGLRAAVVFRTREPFGPIMRGRAADLRDLGLIAPGQRHEELVVIRAERP